MRALEPVTREMHEFYGLIGFMLGLVLSFRVNYALDNWKNSAEAVTRLETGIRQLGRFNSSCQIVVHLQLHRVVQTF